MIPGPLNLHINQSIVDMMTPWSWGISWQNWQLKVFCYWWSWQVGQAHHWSRTWLLLDLVAYLVDWLKSSFLRGLTLGWLLLVHLSKFDKRGQWILGQKIGSWPKLGKESWPVYWDNCLQPAIHSSLICVDTTHWIVPLLLKHHFCFSGHQIYWPCP